MAESQAELEGRPLIRSQTYGAAVDAVGLKQLIRYEIHLDRKLEPSSAMLLKLQDLRCPAEAA